jgi:hypothetical protein
MVVRAVILDSVVANKFNKNIHMLTWATASGTKRRGPRR